MARPLADADGADVTSRDDVSLTRGLSPLLDLLSDRWPAVRSAWRRDVLEAWPGLEGCIEDLARINVDTHVDSLREDRAGAFLADMQEQGSRLARAPVPFPVLMQSLHLFEERCGDELRPALVHDAELWNGISALDKLIHAGVAALAQGYFAALSESHDAEMLAHVHDTTATLCHRINNPLGSIRGRVEMLLRDEQDPARRGWLQSVARSAERIGDALKDLASGTAFSKTPYYSSVRLIASDGHRS